MNQFLMGRTVGDLGGDGVCTAGCLASLALSTKGGKQQSEYALRISKEEWCSAVLLDMTAMSLRDLEHCEVGIQRTPQDFKGIYWVH